MRIPRLPIAVALGLCAALLVGCSTGDDTQPPPATEDGSSTSPGATGPRWVPSPGTTWQWQLTTPIDTSVDAQVYDIDGSENGADVVRAWHAEGGKVGGYVDGGGGGARL